MIFRDLTNRLSVRTIDTGALIAVVWTMGVISTIIFAIMAVHHQVRSCHGFPNSMYDDDGTVRARVSSV